MNPLIRYPARYDILCAILSKYRHVVDVITDMIPRYAEQAAIVARAALVTWSRFFRLPIKQQQDAPQHSERSGVKKKRMRPRHSVSFVKLCLLCQKRARVNCPEKIDRKAEVEICWPYKIVRTQYFVMRKYFCLQSQLISLCHNRPIGDGSALSDRLTWLSIVRTMESILRRS